MKSRVKEWRELRGYTQAQLAAFIGVTPTTIQNLEKDPEPLLKTLRLSAILGCRPEELVYESDSQEDGDQSQVRGKPTILQLNSIKDLLGKRSLTSQTNGQ